MIDLVPEPSRHDHGDLGRDPGQAIDLGERDWDPDRSGPPWAAPAWLTAAAKVAVLALLALLAVPASATSAVKDLGEPLWSAKVTWDGFQLGRDLVFLRDGQHAVSARDARTGVQRWRLETPGEPLTMSEFGPGIDVIISGNRTGEDGGAWQAIFVDSRTGAELFNVPGVSAGFPFPASPPGGQRALLYNFMEPGLAQCPQGCAEITVVDVPSGEPQWRVLLPQESGLALDFVDDGEYGGLAAIAVLEASGRVSVYDGNSSEPVSSMTVEAGSSSAALTSGELIVAYDRDGLMSVTGYSRATGERLWHVTPPLPPLSESSPWHYVQECGALVCATSGAGTTLLEPASGRVVATIGDHAVASADDTLIVSFGGPELSDPTPTVTLRSTADGRVIRQIPGTSVVGWAGADGRTLLAQAVDGGTRFVLVDRQGSTRVLGTIGDRVLTCAARDDLLACHQDFGQVRIWRLPLTD